MPLKEEVDEGMGLLRHARGRQLGDHEILEMALETELALAQELHREDQVAGHQAQELGRDITMRRFEVR
ncbi:hypothetical protein GCM10007874_52030 [Labrys miyagiensis]|uniref:Uncharacterized protein n=1 Tax=Labrys miyagiensis TaxID=346912 RepID=A0ABQ6CPB5_9HYPH|nr:hypothetical protein GCM10007874_52030 [Labrys miyagiensis]